MIYRLNNKILIVDKNDYETNEVYYFRLNFIIHQNIKTTEDFEKFKYISYYLANYYFYNCEYDDPEIMRIIKEYLKIGKLDF